MSKPDFYELLEVTRQCTATELKASYRKKAFEFHPDRNQGNAEAEEMFKLVAEAYDVLSNDNKRAIYDQYGHEGLQGGGGFGQGFSNSDDIFSAFGDIFEDFFGSGGQRGGGRQRMRRGSDLQTEVNIDFIESCFGLKKEISINHNIKCGTCEGSGAKPGTQPETCQHCKGHGQVRMTQGFFTINTTCPHCQGNGQSIRDKCGDCHGSGVVKKERKLKVTIPAGVSDGMRLLMQSEGQAGLNGGPNGDLYVYIHVKEHPEFLRDQDDIHTQLQVNFPDLALGCELKIHTIDGDEMIKVKAGTQSGSVITLRGKGVANVRSGRRGQHIVHVQAHTPQKVSGPQKKLLEQLAKELGPSQGAVTREQASKGQKKKGFFGL